MKYLFVCLIALSLVTFSCEKEAIGPQTNEPTALLAGNNRIPSYTMAEMDALLTEQQDEAAFVKKTEIAAYVLTRWLGEHAGSIGLTGGGTLNGVLPCDMGWLGDGGILRALGQATGIGEAGVATQMSAYVEDCVKGCTLPLAAAQNLVYTLLGSLVHEGQAYTQRTAYAQVAVVNQPRIFISYGIGMTPQGLRALGFQYHLNSNTLTYAEKTPAEALSLGTLLLLPTESGQGAQRFVNPCGITWSYGGGGNGGGGGSGGGNSNIDDDGANKNVVPGPMVAPDTIFDHCAPNIKDGLRVNRLHLADRNEGGLFAGQSEVYLSASFWRNNDPGSVRTNTEGDHGLYSLTQTISCAISEGKHLVSVPASDIGNNSIIIYPPQNRDWTIINSGFCGQGGYDRCKVTLYEHDPVFGISNFKSFEHLDWVNADTCLCHYCPATHSNDTWFTNNSFDIAPQDFASNNDILYFVEVAGGFQVWTYMPGGQYSWFEVEAF